MYAAFGLLMLSGCVKDGGFAKLLLLGEAFFDHSYAVMENILKNKPPLRNWSRGPVLLKVQ
jgi:hypothetical protein